MQTRAQETTPPKATHTHTHTHETNQACFCVENFKGELEPRILEEVAHESKGGHSCEGGIFLGGGGEGDGFSARVLVLLWVGKEKRRSGVGLNGITHQMACL